MSDDAPPPFKCTRATSCQTENDPLSSTKARDEMLLAVSGYCCCGLAWLIDSLVNVFVDADGLPANEQDR